MPNSNTFEIKPIRELIDKYTYGLIIDPFANKNKLANITNDLESAIWIMMIPLAVSIFTQ